MTLSRFSRPAHHLGSQQQPSSSEEELFACAMRDVVPLHTKGRDVVPRSPSQTTSTSASRSRRKASRKGRNKQLVFDLESTPTSIQASLKGLRPKTFDKLKTGSFTVEARLDLHGQTLDEARLSLLAFIRTSHQQGRRCVLLIPGRGNHSPLGMGIIKQEIQTWLTKDPIKQVVLAFCTAQPRHGGAGALYVLLRNPKKGDDNPLWDTIHCHTP